MESTLHDIHTCVQSLHHDGICTCPLLSLVGGPATYTEVSYPSEADSVRQCLVTPGFKGVTVFPRILAFANCLQCWVSPRQHFHTNVDLCVEGFQIQIQIQIQAR